MGRRTAMVLSPRLNPDVRRKTLDVRRAWPSGAAPFLRFTVCGLRGMAYPSFPCESQFPFGRARPRFSVGEVGFGNSVLFPLVDGGQTEWCICCSLPLALAKAQPFNHKSHIPRKKIQCRIEKFSIFARVICSIF